MHVPNYHYKLILSQYKRSVEGMHKKGVAESLKSSVDNLHRGRKIVRVTRKNKVLALRPAGGERQKGSCKTETTTDSVHVALTIQFACLHQRDVSQALLRSLFFRTGRRWNKSSVAEHSSARRRHFLWSYFKMDCLFQYHRMLVRVSWVHIRVHVRSVLCLRFYPSHIRRSRDAQILTDHD